MLIGLAYTAITISVLPLLVLVPYFLTMPILSSHYGFREIGRFTTFFIPVWAVCVGYLLAAIYARTHIKEIMAGTKQ